MGICLGLGADQSGCSARKSEKLRGRSRIFGYVRIRYSIDQELHFDSLKCLIMESTLNIQLWMSGPVTIVVAF